MCQRIVKKIAHGGGPKLRQGGNDFGGSGELSTQLYKSRVFPQPIVATRILGLYSGVAPSNLADRIRGRFPAYKYLPCGCFELTVMSRSG